MAFELSVDAVGITILFGVFSACGVMAVEVIAWFRANSAGGIAEVYQERNGEYYLVKRKRVGLGAETFNIGEREFLVDHFSNATSYTSWNHWGGALPTLKFDIRDAKPMTNDNGKMVPGVKGRPMTTKFTRHPKPSSESMNMMFRRKGLQQIIQATKSVSMDPRLVGVFVGIAAFAAGYLLTNFYHPGLIQAPPPGYYFKVEPIPANATVVHP